MIAVIDYGMANLGSVYKGLLKVGAKDVVVTPDPAVARSADVLVLPGDGAFGACMDNLADAGMVPVLEAAVAENKPVLGICVGLQLFFEESEEMGHYKGLGFWKGQVCRFPNSVKVPQIGWNQIHHAQTHPLLAGVPSGSYVYFVHSYFCRPQETDVLIASTDYGVDYASICGRGNLYGIQFHPEKSHTVGLGILTNFVRMVQGEG